VISFRSDLASSCKGSGIDFWRVSAVHCEMIDQRRLFEVECPREGK
jgi:hypothetical protein